MESVVGSVWYLFSVCRGQCKPWAVTESAQAGWKSSVTVHRLSILSLGKKGPWTHANTVQFVCVCVISVWGKCRWVHQKSPSRFSPLEWWKLVLYKDPLSAGRQQPHREHLSSSMSFSLALSSFVFLSVSHPLTFLLIPSHQRCLVRWKCFSLVRHCSSWEWAYVASGDLFTSKT